MLQRLAWEFQTDKVLRTPLRRWMACCPPFASGRMIGSELDIRPDAKSLGLADYLAWLGNQLTATAVSAYATLGVGFLEARILFALGRYPNQLSAALVQHLGVDRAAISRALQQLRGAGMIVADDQRRLSLSESGWAKYAQVANVSDERLARLTAGLAEPEQEQLLKLLQQLQLNVSELSLLNAHLAIAGLRAQPGHR